MTGDTTTRGGQMHARTTMDAVVLERFGGPDELRYVEGIPAPTLPSGHVLIEVLAAGVNPVDARTRRGEGVARSVGAPPLVLGWDVAGIVRQRGYGARLEEGDLVMGMLAFPLRAGCYATLVIGRARELARVPDGLPPSVAAGLPLAGLTALQALREDAKLRAGQRVGIVGAGGVVGQLATQLARLAGAEVVAVARPHHHARLRELGAAEVLAPGSLAAALAGELHGALDVVVELTGGPLGTLALAGLAAGGTALWLAADATEEERHLAAELEARLVEPDGAGVAELAALVCEGRLRIPLAGELPLAQAAEAHRRLEAGTARGKLVLVPTPAGP